MKRTARAPTSYYEADLDLGRSPSQLSLKRPRTKGGLQSEKRKRAKRRIQVKGRAGAVASWEWWGPAPEPLVLRFLPRILY